MTDKEMADRLNKECNRLVNELDAARRERDEWAEECDKRAMLQRQSEAEIGGLERRLAAANRALALIAPVIEEAMVLCGDEWFEHESSWHEETKPWHTFQQLNQQTALLASDKDAIDVMRAAARTAEKGLVLRAVAY
jgi:chromosome segregation ATPase